MVARARRPAAVLASLLVAGQLASSIHLLLVPHAVCPLDGELVHSNAGGRHQHAAPQARAARLPAVAAVEMREAHHGHDHCVVASNRRSFLASRDGAKGVVNPTRSSGAVNLSEGVLPSARASLYRIAPKQSPPA